MKKSLIYAICCLMLTFSSCQKDELLPAEANEQLRTVTAQSICATQEKMAENLLAFKEGKPIRVIQMLN